MVSENQAKSKNIVQVHIKLFFLLAFPIYLFIAVAKRI